jgi:hypothetical protein
MILSPRLLRRAPSDDPQKADEKYASVFRFRYAVTRL